MNLRNAFGIIIKEVPETLTVIIQGAIDFNESSNEVTVPEFSLWRLKSPENLKFVCERRLIGCETKGREIWLREQINFLEKSFVAKTSHQLWQAYCATDSGRVSFIIDTERSEFCNGPFP